MLPSTLEAKCTIPMLAPFPAGVSTNPWQPAYILPEYPLNRLFPWPKWAVIFVAARRVPTETRFRFEMGTLDDLLCEFVSFTRRSKYWSGGSSTRLSQP